MSATLPKWVTGLSITPENFKKWTSEAGANQVLHWCIENQKVDEDNYLAWAQTHLKIPRLKNNFFDKLEVSPEIEHWANRLPATLIPVMFWEDILYVCCLDASEIPVADSTPHFQPLLGSWLKAVQFRDKMKSTNSAKIPNLDSIMNLDFAALAKPNSSQTPISPAKITVPKPAVSSPEIPSFFATAAVTPAAVVEALTVKAVPVPDTINPTPQVKSSTLPEPIILTPEIKVAAKTESGSVPAAPAWSTDTAFTQNPLRKTLKLSDLNSNTGSSFWGAAFPLNTQNITVIKEASQVQSLDQAPYFLIPKMRALFDQCMILVTEGKTLKPWRWDETWRLDGKDLTYVNLEEQSAFRVVFRSNHSYHGRISISQSHADFFGSWNGGIKPGHLTLVPIYEENKIIAIILGGTSMEKGSKISIQQCEDLAREVTKFFIRPTLIERAKAS